MHPPISSVPLHLMQSPLLLLTCCAGQGTPHCSSTGPTHHSSSPAWSKGCWCTSDLTPWAEDSAGRSWGRGPLQDQERVGEGPIKSREQGDNFYICPHPVYTTSHPLHTTPHHTHFTQHQTTPTSHNTAPHPLHTTPHPLYTTSHHTTPHPPAHSPAAAAAAAPDLSSAAVSGVTAALH